MSYIPQARGGRMTSDEVFGRCLLPDEYRTRCDAETWVTCDFGSSGDVKVKVEEWKMRFRGRPKS